MKPGGQFKIIAVTGAHTDVGKSSLARRLVSILPGAVFIKIGHGKRKEGVNNIFYHTGTPFREIAGDNSGAPFLVIESNSILKEVDPECVIYLPGPGRPKKSAELAMKKADLVRGEFVTRESAELLSRRLEVPEDTVIDIINAAGAVPPGVEQRRSES
ncbi:MAG: hypothetical protein R6U43_04825 [Candidatus Krumholzibacteriales bacterium]